jgi:drug/metabolite transporter (DMT)-like permease
VYAAITLVMFIWAGNFIATKTALREMDALTLASLRLLLAALLITPVYLLQPGKRPLDRGDAGTFVLLALLGVVLNQVLYTVGLSRTTVSHSAVVVGLGPIYVLLLAWMQGLELLLPRKVVGMALAFLGVSLLGAEHGFNLQSGTLLGDLLTMGGSLAFSFYIVLGKKVARRFHSVEINFYLYLAAAVLILPVAVGQAALLPWRAISWSAWAALLYAALFSSVIAYLIYFWALRQVTPSRIAAFSYLLPVIATSFGILVLGEVPTVHLLVGGTLVLVGVYLAETAAADDRTRDQEQQTV